MSKYLNIIQMYYPNPTINSTACEEYQHPNFVTAKKVIHYVCLFYNFKKGQNSGSPVSGFTTYVLQIHIHRDYM